MENLGTTIHPIRFYLAMGWMFDDHLSLFLLRLTVDVVK